MKRNDVACWARHASRGAATAGLFLSVAAAGLAFAGCRGGASDDAATAPEDSTLRVTLEPIATIGCSDCAGDAQITPTVIALLDSDRIAVLDRYEPFVRVFDAEGSPSIAFGSPGQGPGELGTSVGGMHFAGIHLLPWGNGSLSVLEMIPPVIETFAADGAFIQQQTLDLPLLVPNSQAFSPTTGTYFRHAFNPLERGNDNDVIERCVIDFDQGAACDQLTSPAALTGAESGTARAVLSLAATPDGGLVVADATTYRLWRLDGSGNVVREFRRDIPPPPKPADQLEAEREANRARRESGRPEREIDPNRPHIAASGLQVDGGGRIWVLTQRYTEASWVLDVLDENGTFLNEVEVEAANLLDGYQVTPFAVSGDRLAILANQADGSARIEVFRIAVSAVRE